MLSVLDLFSGIGGFSLGLERTGGFSTVAFCEIDPYCRAVLKQHWPDVPIHDDVRTLAGVECDVICGGFPCQDISFAGKGAGIDGERSGLWGEYARLIGELRPQYAIVENVSALLVRGLGRVLGDLAEIGYDAQWHCIPASAVGAPHRRDRIWIVAYPGSEQHQSRGVEISRAIAEELSSANPNADREGEHDGTVNAEVGCAQEPVADPEGGIRQRPAQGKAGHPALGSEDVADTSRELLDGNWRWSEATGRGEPSDRGWWLTEPDVGRVAHGVPSRVDRLRSLGNAVVPQIPEIIGRAILRATP